MFQVLWEEKLCTIGMAGFFVAAVGVLIFLSIKWQGLVRQSENMSITKRKELKAIKTKFSNSYVKNEAESEKYKMSGRINVEIFVDKALGRMKFGGLSPKRWRFISFQLFIVGIAFAGIGVYRGIVLERVFRDIAPFYLFSFMELYVYFSVLGMCDLEVRERQVRCNIIEYIENHMINRLEIASAFQTEEKVFKEIAEKQQKKTAFSPEKERELETLLQDFLV